MKTRDEVLRILAHQKLGLLETYQITKLGLFGSYARGEQNDESDVDVLVEYDQPPNLLKQQRKSFGDKLWSGFD